MESALLEFVYLFLDLFAPPGSHSFQNVENPPFECLGIAGEVRCFVVIFVIRGGELDSLDRLYVRLSGKLRQDGINKIMIGAGEELEFARLGYGEDLGRSLESVGKCRMEVEIEFHRKESEKIGTGAGHLCAPIMQETKYMDKNIPESVGKIFCIVFLFALEKENTIL